MNKLMTLCSSLGLASTIALISAIAPATASEQQSNTTEKLEPYHTHNQTYYQDNKIIDKYLGDLVAIKGKVLKIEQGPENKKIFQLKLTDVNKTIWVATIMNVLEDAIKVGDSARIMGFMDETVKEPQFIAKISQDKEYLLGFCFHIDNSGLPIYFNRFMSRCVQWENGEQFQEETKVVGADVNPNPAKQNKATAVNSDKQ